MATQQQNASNGFEFSKKRKVSVWASKEPYDDIPDEYFEEVFSKHDTQAVNQWSKNFQIKYFNPDNLETNGAHNGVVDIRHAAGECSFSNSFIDVLVSKARKKQMLEISWIILLFEYEYSVRLTGIEKDDIVTFVGAFDYDDDADSLFEPEE